MTSHRRDQMIDAVESVGGFETLRDLVQEMLNAGDDADALLSDLNDIRGLLTENHEDVVLDVMDLLTGWCAPASRLRPQ